MSKGVQRRKKEKIVAAILKKTSNAKNLPSEIVTALEKEYYMACRIS